MPNEQKQEGNKSERWKKRQERIKRVAELTAVKRVRVNPRDDVIRRDILHPVAKMRFPAEGSVEWPLDQFTKRRVRDGDITIEESKPQSEQAQPRHRRHEPSSSSSS